MASEEEDRRTAAGCVFLIGLTLLTVALGLWVAAPEAKWWAVPAFPGAVFFLLGVLA